VNIPQLLKGRERGEDVINEFKIRKCQEVPTKKGKKDVIQGGEGRTEKISQSFRKKEKTIVGEILVMPIQGRAQNTADTKERCERKEALGTPTQEVKGGTRGVKSGERKREGGLRRRKIMVDGSRLRQRWGNIPPHRGSKGNIYSIWEREEKGAKNRDTALKTAKRFTNELDKGGGEE